jgi:hypothetical protein
MRNEKEVIATAFDLLIPTKPTGEEGRGKE